MKILNKIQLNDFLSAVNQSKSDVYLRSQNGDQYNLKSELSMYVAIGALLTDRSEQLELFCANKEDEGYFLKFFADNPETA